MRSAGSDDGAAERAILHLMRGGTVNAVVNHDVLIRQAAGWRISRRVVVPAGAAAAA